MRKQSGAALDLRTDRHDDFASQDLSISAKVIQVTTVPMGLKYLLLDQMKSLRREGFNVLGASAPGNDSSSLKKAGFAHIEIPAFTRSLSLGHDARALWQLFKAFRRERPDIVHSHTPKPTILSTLAARLAGTRVVVSTVHGLYSNESMSRRRRLFYSVLEWLGVLWSHCVIFRSHDDLVRARSWPGVDGDKLMHMTGGIDLTRFKGRAHASEGTFFRRNALGVANAAKVVGFVGRLAEEKGVFDLLSAAPLICEQVPDTHFILIGPKEADEELIEELLTKLQVADVCHLIGQQDDVENWYALMDVFVLPSYREGFPRALMEASAMGIPVITTSARGCRDAVVPDITGVVVRPKDVEQLARAVCHILKNGEVGERLGVAGRDFARQRFDQEEEFDSIKSLYRELLA